MLPLRVAYTPLRIRLEATKTLDREVVYLTVEGFRFELQAPSPAKAREIVITLARALGLDQEDV